VDRHVLGVAGGFVPQHDLEAVADADAVRVHGHCADREQRVALRIEPRRLGVDDDPALGVSVGAPPQSGQVLAQPVDERHG